MSDLPDIPLGRVTRCLLLVSLMSWVLVAGGAWLFWRWLRG